MRLRELALSGADVWIEPDVYTRGSGWWDFGPEDGAGSFGGGGGGAGNTLGAGATLVVAYRGSGEGTNLYGRPYGGGAYAGTRLGTGHGTGYGPGHARFGVPDNETRHVVRWRMP